MVTDLPVEFPKAIKLYLLAMSVHEFDVDRARETFVCGQSLGTVFGPLPCRGMLKKHIANPFDEFTFPKPKTRG